MTVLDSKPTKSVGHFEENKFFCWQSPISDELLSKVDQNIQFWTKCSQSKKIKTIKMNNIVQLGCLISKLPRLFVKFFCWLSPIFVGLLSKVDQDLQFWTKCSH